MLFYNAGPAESQCCVLQNIASGHWYWLSSVLILSVLLFSFWISYHHNSNYSMLLVVYVCILFITKPSGAWHWLDLCMPKHNGSSVSIYVVMMVQLQLSVIWMLWIWVVNLRMTQFFLFVQCICSFLLGYSRLFTSCSIRGFASTERLPSVSYINMLECTQVQAIFAYTWMSSDPMPPTLCSTFARNWFLCKFVLHQLHFVCNHAAHGNCTHL